jgi:acyl-CoA synthetase
MLSDGAAGAGLADLTPPRIFTGDGWLESEQVRDLAARVAGGLLARGVGPGDVVAFQLPPSLECALSFLACWRIGAVAFPIHHRYTAEETASLVRRSGAKLVLTEPDVAALSAGRHSADAVAVEPDSPAMYMATSGTSGQPKIACHTHRTLTYRMRTLADAHGLRADDVALIPAPMAHMGGLLCGLLLPAAAGMGSAFMRKWSPSTALGLIRDVGVTFMVGPPTFFIHIMGTPSFDSRDVRTLRLVSSGGASVTPEFCHNASDVLGAWVKRTYGSTEAPSITTAWHDDPRERGWVTDGRAVGDCELRIDPANQEILVRGPELFTGYVGLPSSLDDGWFRTGDKGMIEDGWLTVLGRLTSTILRGGENVDPVEVEFVCVRYPGVTQAVVVGTPDEALGEVVTAVIVSDREFKLDELRAFCQAQGLAGFKQPERLVLVDSIPMNALGKVDRPALGRILAEQLG